LSNDQNRDGSAGPAWLTVGLLRTLIWILAPLVWFVPPALVSEYVTHNMAVRVAFAVLWVFVVCPVSVWLFFKWLNRRPTKNDQIPERPTSPPPGWYPDPTGAPGTRYWDGGRWNLMARPPAR
jgi:hypothetical protein